MTSNPNLAVPAVVTRFDENVWRIALAGRFLTTSPSLPGAEQIASAINEYVAPLLAEHRRRGEAWDWLSSRTNLELSYDWPDECEPGVWQVHRVSGHVNDREWELIIHVADTALDAVLAARQALWSPTP